MKGLRHWRCPKYYERFSNFGKKK